jgi:hypothetical protein
MIMNLFSFSLSTSTVSTFSNLPVPSPFPCYLPRYCHTFDKLDFHTSVHIKPLITNNTSTFPVAISHPRNAPHLFLRLCMVVTSATIPVTFPICSNLTSAFSSHGYPLSFLQCQIYHIPPSTLPGTNPIYPLIITYHPGVSSKTVTTSSYLIPPITIYSSTSLQSHLCSQSPSTPCQNQP